MQRVTREEYPLDSLQRILNGVTFFKELISHDESQFELLMSIAEIVTAQPNEIIINKGDHSSSLYFLLRGELSVFVDGGDEIKTLNQINAGEVFGVMSMLLNKPRSASIKSGSRQVLLAGIDFNHFSEISDFNLFSLETKLTFYRMVSNNLRWTLERNKIENPAHSLVPRLYKIPLFTGQKNGMDELKALFEQTHLLAELVSEWNTL
jgi:CRP/FNR family cyclic AMP-dependent transcriptional regulator